MLKNLLLTFSKLFIGTGITTRLPWLRRLFGFVLKLVSPKYQIVNIPLGLKMKVQANDTGPGLFLLTKGEYEPFETEIFIEKIKASDTLCDVGAHVGYHSLIAAKLGSKVVAFEPSEENAEL